ncbi:MAG: peptidase [Oscillatoria sp. SIO1A7]|nr:peptidase [Oscillatoria sp. SIO1A7]
MDASTFEKINSLYWIEEPAETQQLLLGHEAMLPLVIEAYDKIRELFAEAKLALEVERDPEIPGWRSLWIMIYSQLDSDEAFEKLKTLDYNWWLDAGYAIGNKLNIDLGWE